MTKTSPAGIDTFILQRGFTLLEMLMALSLLGVVYAVAAPMIDGGLTVAELKAATRQLAAGLRQARVVALAERREATLTLDLESRTFTVSGDPREHPLSRRLDLALFTAQTELMRGHVGSIRFFPDGSSTGGRITVSGSNTRRTVDVDWLTGRVSVD